MISKIIALAIALVLLASAPIYGAVVTPSTSVEFGAGDGTSAVVANPEDLNKIIASIPDLDTYLGVDSITEVDEEFRTFTMVESGYGEFKTPSRPFKTVVNVEGEEEYTRVYNEQIQKMSHTLEIAFGIDGVYYTCVGETVEESIDWEMSGQDSDGYRGNNIYGAEKKTTSYAFELYYAKNTILVKYNDFSIENEKSDFVSNVSWNNNQPDFDYEPVVLTEEDDGYENYKLEKETANALSKCFGKWMQIELPDEDAVPEMPNYEDLANMSEEDQMQYMLDMMVNELVAQYSTLATTSFAQTHKQNQEYLVGLGQFMTGTGLICFDEFGGRYVLKDNDLAREAYLSTVIPQNATLFKMNEYSSNVYFTTNSTDVDLVQIVNLSGKYDEETQKRVTEQTIVVETVTTFKNVGNTVVSLKDTEINTVFEVFQEPFGEMFRETLMEEEAENNG